MKSLSFSLLACSALIGGSSLATEVDSVTYEHISAEPMKIEQRSRTVLGQSYNYPKGIPALYAYSIRIKPGQKTDWHKHEIPFFASIISGSLIVDYGSKGKRTFEKGMSFVEAIDWCHQGYSASNKETVIFGLYLAQLRPNQVKPVACDGPQ
ncbi:MAG: cupin domain-containing protein [Prochlorococcus sp.]|nr:cupin domain-containing protein [Prochlorococcaceae cyanobacterium ETNP2_MAG_10]